MTAKRSRRGGRREGAGRRRARENRLDPQHVTREPLTSKHPVHVMLRTCNDVPRLRQRRFYQAMRAVLRRYLHRRDFRVVHISIQRDHLHLIVEASGTKVLSRRMQSFAINAARSINKAAGRRGKVFRFRYRAKQVRTRDYARNAIAYVLNNWRRHREDEASGVDRTAQLDAYSSAISFTGWKGSVRWKVPIGYEPLPVSAPRTDLLRSAWQWFGRIDPFETPGPSS